MVPPHRLMSDFLINDRNVIQHWTPDSVLFSVLHHSWQYRKSFFNLFAILPMRKLTFFMRYYRWNPNSFIFRKHRFYLITNTWMCIYYLPAVSKSPETPPSDDRKHILSLNVLVMCLRHFGWIQITFLNAALQTEGKISCVSHQSKWQGQPYCVLFILYL